MFNVPLCFSIEWLTCRSECRTQLSWKRKLATVKSSKADVSSVSPSSLWLRANARNDSLWTLCGGQFTFSSHLITLNYPAILSHRRSTTVSLETYPLYSEYRTANFCDVSFIYIPRFFAHWLVEYYMKAFPLPSVCRLSFLKWSSFSLFLFFFSYLKALVNQWELVAP